jgi:hypothetical protein
MPNLLDSLRKINKRQLEFDESMQEFVIADNPIVQWWSEQGFRGELLSSFNMHLPSLDIPLTDEEVYQAFDAANRLSGKMVDPEGLKNGMIRPKIYRGFSLLSKTQIIYGIIFVIFLEFATYIINPEYIKLLMSILILILFGFLIIFPVLYFGELNHLRTGRSELRFLPLMILVIGSSIFFQNYKEVWNAISTFFKDLFLNTPLWVMGILLISAWIIGFILIILERDYYNRKMIDAVHRIRQY